MKVHAAVAKALVDNGVDTMFGLLGDGNLFMADRFVHDHDTDWIATAHEAGAVLAALGYANFSGRVGVATVTHGPGLTNAVTALAEGVRARTPAVVIAGDTAIVDKHNPQNIDQRAIVASTDAGFEQLRAPSTAVDDVAFALRRAAIERRPIVLNLPYEFQWEEIEYKRSDIAPVQIQPAAAEPGVLDRAVGMIATARRPLILAGRGASDPETMAAVVRLADRLDAPLATTVMGKDLFRDHPHNLGVCGTLSHSVADETIRIADCVIAFGASLNNWTRAQGAYLGGKRVIHVDTDRASIGHYFSADCGVIGDARLVADAVVTMLDEAEVPSTGFRTPELAAQLAECAAALYRDLGTDTTVDVRTAIRAIDAAVPDDRNLVLDAGRFLLDAFTMFRAPDPRSFLSTVTFGSIGLGMGAALGAAKARPDRPTLIIAGDGGFMLGGLVEFSTACRNNMDIIVVVINDDSYGAEHIQFRARALDPAVSLQNWPDFAPVAVALGGDGITIRNAQDLNQLADAVGGRTRPLLIDVKIDPDMVSRGRSIH